jgi:hypothetical protein
MIILLYSGKTITMKNYIKIAISLILTLLFLIAWAPWMDDQAVHDRVFRAKANIDGTMGGVTYPNGTKRYQLICDYKVSWIPFGRWVASCEGGYYVTFWGKIK